MRINSREWGKHEMTRKRLESAWEETKKREPIRRWEAHNEDTQETGQGGNAIQHQHSSREKRGIQWKERSRKSARNNDDEDACITLDF